MRARFTGLMLAAMLMLAGGTAAYGAEAAREAGGDEELVELWIELPPPSWLVNGPKHLTSEILDPETGKLPKPFMAPPGLANVAKGRPVTSSAEKPIAGTLQMVTDGDKRADEASFIVLPAGPQWVQLDLGDEQELYAVVLWLYHRTTRIYHDIVVQLSNDSTFATGVTTIYNNDQDNSLGLGKGKDWEWIETNMGRLIDAKGTVARYIRCYSNGSTDSDTNEYVEIEAHGRTPGSKGRQQDR